MARVSAIAAGLQASIAVPTDAEVMDYLRYLLLSAVVSETRHQARLVPPDSMEMAEFQAADALLQAVKALAAQRLPAVTFEST